MPCTIQSILVSYIIMVNQLVFQFLTLPFHFSVPMSQASDDLRVTRLLAMVQTSHLSHAGVWILTLVVSFKLLMIFCRSI